MVTKVPDEAELAAFAEAQGVSLPALRALIESVRAQVGADQLYIFWTTSGAGSGGGSARRRMLLAFATPDAALAFAQRNRLAGGSERPRLRRLRLPQLIQAVLREPAIGALLIAAESDPRPPQAGQLPHGVRIERADLLRRLYEAAS